MNRQLAARTRLTGFWLVVARVVWQEGIRV
jgi:hypothetical protein